MQIDMGFVWAYWVIVIEQMTNQRGSYRLIWELFGHCGWSLCLTTQTDVGLFKALLAGHWKHPGRNRWSCNLIWVLWTLWVLIEGRLASKLRSYRLMWGLWGSYGWTLKRTWPPDSAHTD